MYFSTPEVGLKFVNSQNTFCNYFLVAFLKAEASRRNVLTDRWKRAVFNVENINKSEGKVVLVKMEKFVIYRWNSDH